jgi:hypothetical protein
MAVTRAFHRWVASRRLKRLDQLEKAITVSPVTRESSTTSSTRPTGSRESWGYE